MSDIILLDSKTETELDVYVEYTSNYKKDVDAFKLFILNTYGINIEVLARTNPEDFNIKILNDVVNNFLLLKYGLKYIEGLKDRSRLQELVIVRKAFCKIAKTNGATHRGIKVFTDLTHAAVIHMVQSAINLIKTKDPLFLPVYLKIIELYEIETKTKLIK